MQGCSQSLTLHVRTLAWLGATLKPSTPSKKSRRSEDPPITRRQKFEDEGRIHDVPKPGPAAYLLDYLWELGTAEDNGMRVVPISHAELLSWQQLMGLRLTPWESATLRQLSSAYCAELATATDPMADAPGSALATPQQLAKRRKDVSHRLAGALRDRAAQPRR